MYLYEVLYWSGTKTQIRAASPKEAWQRAMTILDIVASIKFLR